ncbi:HET-domain-containing protein [Macroventuria anomochaeta]|uniref:HET-domain-containing protein n=1 Tax=Macroventuria anomochaeta TaxID=301207 RepID=A0ACB6S657_9PLEO|nr:HET-domain-containing protein [Macroventuria anomochaeta]KAF2629576.1 HET-domain-containing protein [Macroventuria anomochaeta]
MDMLGPESHVYDPLPTPTSVRVLLLAPGKQEDDIFCYLFTCDLDKDRTIDISIPRPFESTCVATAKRLDGKDPTKSFILQVDSYIDESEEGTASDSDIQPTSAKGNGLRPSQVAPKVSSFPTDTADEYATISKAGEYSAAFDRTEQGDNSEILQKVQDVASSFLNNDSTEAADSEEQPNEEHEMSDDWWDVQQLTKLTMANGALNHRVHRHPFQRYTALSYVWGSVEDPAHITLEGHARFQVTGNLFNALKCLRRPDAALALWVDAICINQNDPEEKRVQIGLMRRVYKQARRVIAYVPQEPEDIETFNELVGKILQAYAQCRKAIDSGAGRGQQEDTDGLEVGQEAKLEQHGQQEDGASVSDASGLKVKMLPLKPTGTCIEDYDMPPEDDPAWFAWRRFFASPYFRRIWILQEFTLAKNLYLHNGRSEETSSAILLVMHAVSSMSRMLNAQYLGRGEDAELGRAAALGWRGLEMMNMERVFAQEDLHDEVALKMLKERSRLIDKIRYAFDFDATDPRDRIYALLGLVSDSERFQHLVSYQPADTYPKIYRRFAKALIEQGHLVQVLHMSCKTPSSLRLPSWVPVSPGSIQQLY